MLGSLTHAVKVFPSELKLVLNHHLCCYVFSVGERFLVEQHLFIAKFSLQCSAMMIADILEYSFFFLRLGGQVHETTVLKISDGNLDCPVQVHCGVTAVLSLVVRGSSLWQGFQSWVCWKGNTYRNRILLIQTGIRVFSGVL